jgi:hypothetical protein
MNRNKHQGMDTMKFAPKTLHERIAEASELANNVYPSKAAQKRALEAANRAYEVARELAMDLIRKDAPIITTERDDENRMAEVVARHEYFMTNDVPFDLHRVRGLHYMHFEAAEIADEVSALVHLREMVKAAEICAPQPKNAYTVEIEARIHKTISEIFKLRQTQYLEGLRIAEIFGTLNVYVNGHWVTNQYGTTFKRCFYYMEGKLTPLNIILAVLQEHQRKEDAKAA